MGTALFDMDRTLIRKDTASLYIRYQKDIGEAGLFDVARVGWWMFQYTLGVIDAERVAAQALSQYRGQSEDALRQRCVGWFEDYVREHICERGRRAVETHRERGDLIAIVTGATRYATEPLARELGIEHVICTELDVGDDGKLTGQLVEPLCFGEGKITRAEAFAKEHGIVVREASFYSDSITDLPLLNHVSTPVVVNPDRRLRKAAENRGWPIESW